MKKFTFLLAALAISLVTFAQGTITYNLNGGVTNDYGWKNINDVYVSMNADWNTYSGSTKTWKPLAEITPSTANTGFAASVSDPKIFDFFVDEIYGPKYGWILDYVKKVFVDQGNDISKFDLVPLRWNVSNFFVCGNTNATGWQLGCDYTIAGQVESYQPTWKHGYCGPATYAEGETVVIPAPYKEGETFLGWYKEADFSGEKVTTISGTGDVVLYAKFGEYIPTIAEVIAMENETATKVQGTVTYAAGSNFWIQDATGGILCYGKDNGLTEGELVTLSGVKTIFNGSPELNNATVVVKEAGTEVSAQTLILSAIVADTTDSYINELVFLQGVTFSKYEDNGNYKTPYVTDGINEIALYNWKDVTEDKYPVGTKVSVKAVLSIYNTKLQLRGKEEWIAVAAAAGKDNYEYPEVNVDGFKFNLANNWLYSYKLGNWDENKPNALAEGSRSVVEKDGILYFSYRNANTPTEKPKLVRVDAKTGKMFDPIFFSENMFKDANGNWYEGPFTDLKLDNAGNAITSNYSQKFQIWSVDLTTGQGTILIDCATDSSKWMSRQFPEIELGWVFDRIGVYGDINGDATIMTALRNSIYVFYWAIEDGEWDGVTNMLALEGFAEGENFGTATVPCPIEGDYFYIDGFNTYPILYTPDGVVADAFTEEHEANHLLIGSNNVARAKGHNGVTEFEVNGEYYLIIAGDNTDGKGTAPSTFVLYKFADEYREFKDMTQLYEFPMEGMGNNSNPQRVATSFARPNEDGTAVEIYAFTAENGYGAYTLSIAEGGDPVAVDNVAIDSNVWVENNTIVANAQIEGIFTVAGQNVTALNGNLTAGAYIVRTAEGIAKVMVK